MRMPLVCSSAIGVCGVFTLLWLPARLGAAEPDPDEAVLRRAGVSADDKSLLTFFRARAGNDDDLARVGALVRQLGSTSFKAREEAAEKLVRLGPAAEEALSEAVRSKDSEVVDRAKTVLRKTRDRHDAVVVSAALRLLTRKRPEGTVEALLRYLPYGAHGPLTDELWFALDALAAARPKADPAIVKALDDPVAVRRAAAAYLTARRGDPSQQEAVRQRLADADPLVRLRAAQGLLGRGRKEALPVLLDLLRETPLEVAWQAEELLHWAAGEQAPETVVGAGSEAAGGRCRDAWRAWWQKRGDALDLSRVAKGGRRPGLVLASWGSTHRNLVTVGAVWLVGCSGGPRLEVRIGLLAQDMHLLPGGRLLLAEWGPGTYIRRAGNVTIHDAGRITIRDAEGQVLWRYETKWPNSCSPLAGGNLLVAGGGVVTEVSPPTGQTVWSHIFAYGRQGVPSLSYPQRLPNGNFVGFAELDRGRVDLVETDPEGARVVKQVTVQDTIRETERIKVSNGRTYLLAGSAWDGVIREIDGSGKTVWKSRPLYANDVALLNDGTLVVATGKRVVEITRSGGVAWEALVPADDLGWARAARPCLRLVRLGFDAPRPADLDLDTSVQYRLAGLGSRNPDARRWSARVLERMGTKAEVAVPALIKALDDPDTDTQHAACDALRQVVGPKTFPLLLTALTARNPRVRVAVISVCASRKEQSKAIVPALIKMLKDYEVGGEPRFGGLKVCQAAAMALENHGASAVEAVPALAEALKSGDALLRCLAARALGSIGPGARGAVPALKEALNDPEKGVRDTVAESLKKIQR
ncbi:MAG: HEAT repeat domain-containing protein [Planctomycetes bacterium]|nr:HEAT repeat domain-containing protein [Planctomycetota bacterium]